jgi:hypothetical protein
MVAQDEAAQPWVTDKQRPSFFVMRPPAEANDEKAIRSLYAPKTIEFSRVNA